MRGTSNDIQRRIRPSSRWLRKWMDGMGAVQLFTRNSLLRGIDRHVDSGGRLVGNITTTAGNLTGATANNSRQIKPQEHDPSLLRSRIAKKGDEGNCQPRFTNKQYQFRSTTPGLLTRAWYNNRTKNRQKTSLNLGYLFNTWYFLSFWDAMERQRLCYKP
jgi:hypothetical protein